MRWSFPTTTPAPRLQVPQSASAVRLRTPNSITPSSVTASGRVVPAAAPPSEGLKAVGEVILAPAESSSLPAIGSGLIINAKVSERFDLLSGDPVVPTDYVQDLVLYR